MPFPITYLLDHPAPSETFIRRELEQLRRHNWPIFTRCLKGGASILKFSLRSCPEGFRWGFLTQAAKRVLTALLNNPVDACRIVKRLPQAADLVRKAFDTDSRLIHAHFAGLTADLAAIAAHTLRVPWTCSVHAHDVFASPPERLFRRLCSATSIAACSQDAADAVIAAGVSREKITVIRHGLPLNDFPFDTIQPDGLILFVGRLEPKKGVHTLLHACALLLEQDVNFTCLIIGEGSCLKDLKGLNASLGLDDTVFFTGWQSPEETRSRIIDATILALPSIRLPNGDRDGIANVLIEAMALGTPVLTTTASAAPEIITDQVNGLLVPPDSPTSLADALAKALASKDRLIRLAKEARKTVENDFDASRNIEGLEDFFNRAVAPQT